MALTTSSTISIQTIMDEQITRRTKGESFGDFAMLNYVRACPIFLPVRDSQDSGLSVEFLEIVRHIMFHAHDLTMLAILDRHKIQVV